MDLKPACYCIPTICRPGKFLIRDCLQNACGYPVWFGNDASVAAYGEFWVGRGIDHHSIVFFTLGTGSAVASSERFQLMVSIVRVAN